MGHLNYLRKYVGGYIYFDEGFQSYGKAWNAVIDNFPMSEFIVFMEPQYMLGRACITRLIEVLQRDKCGIAAPKGNGFEGCQHMDIDAVDTLNRWLVWILLPSRS